MSTYKNPEAAPSNHSLKFIILSMNSQFLEYFESPMHAAATWEHFLQMNILTTSDILGVGLISEQILALQS
jgi:hypothetical protein